MEVRPVEFYVKGITLREALKKGLVDKLVQQLEKAGIKVKYVVLILDPEGEPGLIRIGHASSMEAEKGGLRISFDPDMSEKVRKALEEALRSGGG